MLPRVPEHSSDDEIVDALSLIDEALGKFPYRDTASHAYAFGLLLTPLIRQSISGQVPIALLDAPRPGAHLPHHAGADPGPIEERSVRPTSDLNRDREQYPVGRRHAAALLLDP